MWVEIEKIITKKRKSSLCLNKTLQSNEPILVDKKGSNFILINGNHRYFKLLEMGRKRINVKIRRGI